jgi:hypothetical protein
MDVGLEREVLERQFVEQEGLEQDFLGQIGPGWEDLER